MGLMLRLGLGATAFRGRGGHQCAWGFSGMPRGNPLLSLIGTIVWQPCWARVPHTAAALVIF
jgi:hypothetical protein